MVKTFLNDFPICILIGLVFSLYKSDIEREDPFYRFASFWWGLLGVSILAALAVYTFQKWPAWMWMYFIEPFPIKPLGWSYLLFLLYLLPYIVGYLLGIHGRRESWFVLFNSFAVIIFLLVFGLHEFWDRYTFIKEEQKSIFEAPHWRNIFLSGGGGITLFTLVCGLVARRNYIRALESGTLVKHLFHPGKRRTLQKIAEAMLPEAPDLRKVSAKDMPLADIFSRELADISLPGRIAFRIFVDYLNSTPFIYMGIPFRFEFLSKEKQLDLLDRMAKSQNINKKVPLTVIRMFLLQFYYQDQRVLDELGYVGETLGIFRPHLRWMNVPEYRENERSVVWSALTKTMKKTSK